MKVKDDNDQKRREKRNGIKRWKRQYKAAIGICSNTYFKTMTAYHITLFLHTARSRFYWMYNPPFPTFRLHYNTVFLLPYPFPRPPLFVTKLTTQTVQHQSMPSLSLSLFEPAEDKELSFNLK